MLFTVRSKLQQVVVTATNIPKLQDKKERLQELAGHGGAQLQLDESKWRSEVFEVMGEMSVFEDRSWGQSPL